VSGWVVFCPANHPFSVPLPSQAKVTCWSACLAIEKVNGNHLKLSI